MEHGRHNVTVGLLFIAGFMVLGFVLVYLRDFSPDREEWIAKYAEGAHFETRLAHVHGTLFALLNVAIGLVLPRIGVAAARRRVIAWLAIVGMLMPLGILGEVTLGLPPAFVLIGGASMFAGVAWAGVAWARSSLPA